MPKPPPFSAPQPVSRRAARSALLAGVAALALVCSCSKPPPPAPPEPTPAPTPIPQPPTPTPSPVPSGPPTPTPVVHRYAPDGTFYVMEEVTVRLKAGIMGVIPGTEVKMIKNKGEMSTVSDGTQEFEIKSALLTNDLDEAAKIQKGAASAEQASAAFRQQQQAAYEKQQQDQVEFLRAHPLGGNVTRTPTPPRR